MTGRTAGKAWLRTLSARLAAIGGMPRDDAPMPFPDFDGILTNACGARQKRGNERSQGPDHAIRRAIGRDQLVKWFQGHHMSVQHDAEGPRTIRMVMLFGMGDSRHKHVWVDQDAHADWVAGGAGAGWGVNPVEFDCRLFDVDEIVVLTEAVHRHAFGSAAQWNFRCTPAQVAEIAARKAGGRRTLYPQIRLYEPGVSTIDALRDQIDPVLLQKARRIVGLFEHQNTRAKVS